jgi:hypothetical protein
MNDARVLYRCFCAMCVGCLAAAFLLGVMS